MKILFVIERLPFPLIGGDRLHIYHYLKELKKRGYDITLVTLITDEDDLEGALADHSFFDKLIPVKFNKKFAYINAIKAIFTGNPFITEYFYSHKVHKIVNKEVLTGNYDIIIGHIYRSLPYIKNLKNIKKVIHICDAFSLKYKRRIEIQKSLWEKFKIYCEYIRVKKAEVDCCKYSDKQIFISNADINFLSKIADTKKSTVIGLATDTEYYKQYNEKLENDICFVGAMWTIPNLQAAKYFATEVFPLVKKEIPDAKFKIIGAKPKQELYEIAKEMSGVEILGRVEDVREYRKKCKVSVCPTQIASGIQNKILEAMSMGIPVVTTPEGYEGIGANENLLRIAKTPDEYARKVVEIMQNDELRKTLSEGSRQFILDNFSWDKIGEQWDKVLKEVCNEKNSFI